MFNRISESYSMAGMPSLTEQVPAGDIPVLAEASQAPVSVEDMLELTGGKKSRVQEETLLLPSPAMQRGDLLTGIIKDHTGSAKVDRLVSMLSRFPTGMLQKVKDHGVVIHILKDNPAEGELRPTDLGFGQDLDKDGKITPGKWVDLNNNGINDPGEVEDLTSGGYSWNDVKGAYDLGSNILFYKEADVNTDSDFYNAMVLHEFAHAVDDTLRDDKEIGPAWSQGVDGNFEAAKNKEPGHGYVDGYAASTRGEYLAQSVASYLTDKDIPDDPSNDGVIYFAPDNINKKNLQVKDQAMFEFLEGYFVSGKNMGGSSPERSV